MGEHFKLLKQSHMPISDCMWSLCTSVGKDDKFQLFVCLAVHDRLLQRIVADLTKAVAAIQLYDEFSFLR